MIPAQRLVTAAHGYRDPVRAGHRVRLRIDVIPQATSIPGVKGRVPHGIQEVVVHSEDVTKVLDLKEEHLDHWAQCEQLVAGLTREYVLKTMRRGILESQGGPMPDDPKQWPERMREWPEPIQRVAEKFTADPAGTTVANEFRRMHLRSRKPLRSVEVVDDHVPAEITEDAQRTADAVHLIQAQSPESAVLQRAMALIEDLQREVDELKGKTSASNVPGKQDS